MRLNALSALCCKNFTACSLRFILPAVSVMESCLRKRRDRTCRCRSVRAFIATDTSADSNCLSAVFRGVICDRSSVIEDAFLPASLFLDVVDCGVVRDSNEPREKWNALMLVGWQSLERSNEYLCRYVLGIRRLPETTQQIAIKRARRSIHTAWQRLRGRLAALRRSSFLHEGPVANLFVTLKQQSLSLFY